MWFNSGDYLLPFTYFLSDSCWGLLGTEPTSTASHTSNGESWFFLLARLNLSDRYERYLAFSQSLSRKWLQIRMCTQALAGASWVICSPSGARLLWASKWFVRSQLSLIAGKERGDLSWSKKLLSFPQGKSSSWHDKQSHNADTLSGSFLCSQLASG